MSAKLKCPYCQNPVNIGELLAQIKTPAKSDASRKNGSAPVKPGSNPRGWPKGKKRTKKGKL